MCPQGGEAPAEQAVIAGDRAVVDLADGELRDRRQTDDWSDRVHSLAVDGAQSKLTGVVATEAGHRAVAKEGADVRAAHAYFGDIGEARHDDGALETPVSTRVGEHREIGEVVRPAGDPGIWENRTPTRAPERNGQSTSNLWNLDRIRGESLRALSTRTNEVRAAAANGTINCVIAE